jgi:hypothetical protein
MQDSTVRSWCSALDRLEPKAIDDDEDEEEEDDDDDAP